MYNSLKVDITLALKIFKLSDKNYHANTRNKHVVMFLQKHFKAYSKIASLHPGSSKEVTNNISEIRDQ